MCIRTKHSTKSSSCVLLSWNLTKEPSRGFIHTASQLLCTTRVVGLGTVPAIVHDVSPREAILGYPEAGVAVAPRLTQDVDLTIFLSCHDVANFHEDHSLLLLLLRHLLTGSWSQLPQLRAWAWCNLIWRWSCLSRLFFLMAFLWLLYTLSEWLEWEMQHVSLKMHVSQKMFPLREHTHPNKHSQICQDLDNQVTAVYNWSYFDPSQKG